MIQNWDSTQNEEENNATEENFDSSSEDSASATGDDSSANDDDASQNSNGNGSFKQLQQELEEAKIRLQELTRISQQALADLQNYKKRSEEEKRSFAAYANANLIAELLPILDNIDRAVTHLPEEPAAKEWAQGIIGILKQMENVLQAKGLNPIETHEQDFDPNVHEAVMTEEGPTDKILRQLEKGYKFGEKILRRAKVTVGHGEEEKKEEEKSDQ